MYVYECTCIRVRVRRGSMGEEKFSSRHVYVYACTCMSVRVGKREGGGGGGGGGVGGREVREQHNDENKSQSTLVAALPPHPLFTNW